MFIDIYPRIKFPEKLVFKIFWFKLTIGERVIFSTVVDCLSNNMFSRSLEDLFNELFTKDEVLFNKEELLSAEKAVLFDKGELLSAEEAVLFNKGELLSIKKALFDKKGVLVEEVSTAKGEVLFVKEEI